MMETTETTSSFPARVGTIGWRLALALIIALTFYPFFFMLMTSFKDTAQFYHHFWWFAWPLNFSNYTGAFDDLSRAMLNSLVVTLVSISGILVLSVITGFLFARYDFPGRQWLYYGMLVMMMVPGVLTLIPAFMWVKQLGLLDTYAVMILPAIAGGQVLGTYLLRGFFGEIDQDLFEAAQVDGAGLLRQLWHVALPLSIPILSVVAITSALGVWNSFIWPLVTTSRDEVMVLTIAMQRYGGRIPGQTGQMFAGYAISAVPLALLFGFFTRTFMRGLTSGALKA